MTGCADGLRSTPTVTETVTATATATATTIAIATDTPSGTQPRSRVAPRGIVYTTVDGLVQDYETASGNECAPVAEGKGPMFAHDHARCGSVNLAIYSSQEDRDAQISMTRRGLAEFDLYTEWVMGENWTITSDEDNLTELAVLLGGDVIGLGDVEAAD